MPPIVTWSTPPTAVTLTAHELHIWRASLDVPPASLQRFSTYLLPAESARAQRFVFPSDRDHFIVGRGILRALLSRYLLQPPASIHILEGSRGKPYFSREGDGPSLRFNVSHSYGLALYVFAVQREVGIDIEKIRPEFATMEIAERYFSAREREELRGLPAGLRTEGFFLCWTRKEAYVKARGDGLQIPLDSFDVSLTPSQPAILKSADSARWSLRSFCPAPECVAAVVAEGSGGNVEFFDWTE
jgi:4'-phosphopantetheinyl transferase